MKRDMDFVRMILFAIEGVNVPVDAFGLIVDGRPSLEEAAFRIELLQTHGLINPPGA